MSGNYGDVFQRLHHPVLELTVLRTRLSWWKCNKKPSHPFYYPL